MSFNAYKITRVLPCLADPEKIRVVAEVLGEIQKVFPYLNATLEGCIYNHPALTLTFKKGDKIITLHPLHITLTKIDNEEEAEKILGWLQNLVNETYLGRDKIQPDYTMRQELKPTDIIKLLPGTNCKKCGLLTCLAFAFKLLRDQIGIEKCAPLFSDEFTEKRKLLFETLRNAGLKVPAEPFESGNS
jgi:ArsR family metal-binding transcriptional regulator